MSGISHGNIMVGLDVGTTKMCVVVGETIDGELELRGFSTSPSKGLRKGVVVNIEATVESIKNAVKAAENVAGVEINSVYAGISGGHIKGIGSHGAVGIRGREVSALDVERALESAKAVYVPLDREVLNVVPTGYVLDGQDGIKNPVGMVGDRLEAKAYIITGAVASVQNLLKCCEKAGVEVVDIVFEPLASAEAILTDEEREQGVAVVDIGGGTTDIILYKDGWLRHSSVIAVGGNHFTNDISVGLRLSITEAERIKKDYGSALTELIDDSEEIDIIQSGQGKVIPRKHLAGIIEPRAEELLELIKSELASCSGYEMASTGVVLTGGGSMLDGLATAAEPVLGLPVRIGFPVKINGSADIIRNPMYATGTGLVLYGFHAESGGDLYADTFTGVFGKMRNWVKGIFK